MANLAGQTSTSHTTYHEKKIDKTLYRITSEYNGKIEFATALEDLFIRKILRDEEGIVKT